MNRSINKGFGMNESTIDRVGKMTSVEFYEAQGHKRALSEVKNFSSSAGLSGGKL